MELTTRTTPSCQNPKDALQMLSNTLNEYLFQKQWTIWKRWQGTKHLMKLGDIRISLTLHNCEHKGS